MAPTSITGSSIQQDLAFAEAGGGAFAPIALVVDSGQERFPSTGAASEAYDVWVGSTGSITNYRSLRARLRQLGHRFRNDGTNELLLRAYQAWSDDVAEHVEGSCAFVVWDRRRERVVMVRDRLGLRRLYGLRQAAGGTRPLGLVQDDGSLGAIAIASDMRTLLALARPTPTPDPGALAFLLTLGYIPSPHSIWQDVHKVGPGQCVTWERHTGLRGRTYWEPPRRPGAAQPDRWEERFEQCLDDICAPHEPVGVLLSGGLDSTSIALGMQRLGRRPVALSFQTDGCPDESGVALAVADHLGLPVAGCERIGAREVDSLLDRVVTAFDEPQCHAALLTSFLMNEAAARHFGVLLSGDGAEEVLGGYRWYDRDLGPELAERYHAVRLPSPTAAAGTPRRPLLRQFTRGLRWARTLCAGRWPQRRHTAAQAIHRPYMFLPEEVRRLLEPVGGGIAETAILAPLRTHDAATLAQRRRLQRLDLMTFCADALLPKVQQTAAANGLDLRAPFLDRRIVDWAIAQPLDPRELRERKPILRDYLAGRVPDAVLNLPKHGLNPPWLDLFDRRAAIAEVRSGYWVREGYLSPRFAERLRGDTAPCRARLWTLFSLTRWASAWLE